MDENVRQLASVTGCTLEDSRKLLDACGGNLDLAINMHLDTKDTKTKEKAYEEKYGVRAPISQASGVLIEDEPVHTRRLRSRRLPRTVFDPFQDYSGSKNYQNPKKKALSDLFKPPFDLMFQGTFQQARDAGRVRKKWLIVNLQDSQEFVSQVLNRDVWSNYTIKDMINKDFIFWQVHSITDDGLKFKQLYHVSSIPCIFIIDPRTGEKLEECREFKPNDVINAVKSFLSSHSMEERTHSPEDRGILDQCEYSQVEAAIRASLEEVHKSVGLSDSESDDSFSSSEEDEPKKPLSGCENVLLGKKRMMEDWNGVLQRKSLKTGPTTESGHTPSESSTVSSDRGKAKANSTVVRTKGVKRKESVAEQVKAGKLRKEEVTCIVTRLPDGTRLENSFIALHPIEELFEFLRQQDIDMNLHEVVTHFPKRSISSLSSNTSFREAGLHPRETVFVQLDT